MSAVLIIDGIFMHKALYQAESLYKEIYPDKEFKRVNLSNIINHIISYSQNWSKTISTSFLVTNSVYDGSHAIHFDCEEVVANRKFVPVHLIKTDNLIWYKTEQLINEYNDKDIILCADDRAYYPTLNELNSEILLIRYHSSQTTMPGHLKWFDVNYIMGLCLGLELEEL